MVTLRSNSAWYDDELREKKPKKCRLERKYRSFGLEVFSQLFKEACKDYNVTIEYAKLKYYKNLIENSDGTKLFKIVDRMFTIRKTCILLPKQSDVESLAEQFNEYFVTKIEKLRSKLDCTVSVSMDITREEKCLCSFTDFKTISKTDIHQIIVGFPTNSCQLNPLPTKMVKEIDILTRVITDIANGSLAGGEFPTELKLSFVRPSIKKLNVGSDQFPNYRPISNLAFLSKTIERTAVSQMEPYLVGNDLYPKIQSAYRKFHSTETALLKVSNDILRAVDQHQEVVLVLLDLSSAFDTIDHEILLDRMKSRFGFDGNALRWFKSYLENRVQSVKIEDFIMVSRRARY